MKPLRSLRHRKRLFWILSVPLLLLVSLTTTIMLKPPLLLDGRALRLTLLLARTRRSKRSKRMLLTLNMMIPRSPLLKMQLLRSVRCGASATFAATRCTAGSTILCPKISRPISSTMNLLAFARLVNSLFPILHLNPFTLMWYLLPKAQTPKTLFLSPLPSLPSSTLSPLIFIHLVLHKSLITRGSPFHKLQTTFISLNLTSLAPLTMIWNH